MKNSSLMKTKQNKVPNLVQDRKAQDHTLPWAVQGHDGSGHTDSVWHQV